MRATDLLLAFPYFLLTIVFVAVLGPSLLNAMIAIAAWTAPHYIRLVRSVVLSVKGREFVEAARALGRPELGILTRHILPACVPTLVVQAAIFCAQNMLMAREPELPRAGRPAALPRARGDARRRPPVPAGRAPGRRRARGGHLPRRARLQFPRRRAPRPSRPRARAGPRERDPPSTRGAAAGRPFPERQEPPCPALPTIYTARSDVDDRPPRARRGLVRAPSRPGPDPGRVLHRAGLLLGGRNAPDLQPLRDPRARSVPHPGLPGRGRQGHGRARR